MQNVNKKGNLESPSIVVGLFVLAFGIIISFMILDAGDDAFVDDPTASGLLNNANTMLSRIGNNGFAMAAFALILFNMVGAFLLVTHPIFVIIDIMFMPFSIYLAAIISNAYEASIETLTVAANFGVMNFVMGNLVIIIVVADIITAIVAYSLFKDNF